MTKKLNRKVLLSTNLIIKVNNCSVDAHTIQYIQYYTINNRHIAPVKTVNKLYEYILFR